MLYRRRTLCAVRGGSVDEGVNNAVVLETLCCVFFASVLSDKVMTHVVDALGPGKGPDLDRIAVTMVDVATKVGSDEAVRCGRSRTPRPFYAGVCGWVVHRARRSID